MKSVLKENEEARACFGLWADASLYFLLKIVIIKINQDRYYIVSGSFRSAFLYI